MPKLLLGATLVVLTTAFGCTKEDGANSNTGGTGQGGTQGGGAGTSGSSGTAGGGSGGMTAGAGGAMSGSGGSSGTAGGGMAGDTGEGGTGAEGGAPSCEPESGDGECFECMRANCCDAVGACEADTACSECVECVDAEMDVGTCSLEPMNYCDVLSAGPTQTMLICLLEQCETECGFN
jgi:hypothetical protein